jgi:biotin transport system substrate-specific component
MSTAAAHPLGRSGVLADLIPGALVRDTALVGGYAVAIALSSRLAVPLPFTPVPITAQTFVVLLGAAALGVRRAGFGAALYLVLGLAGTPWFAVTGGATLGYILGFVLAAMVVGRLAARGADRSLAGTVGMMVAGNLVIYACGVSFLAFYLGVGPGRALALGAVPFLLGDLVKVLGAAVLLPAAWRFAGRHDG